MLTYQTGVPRFHAQHYERCEGQTELVFKRTYKWLMRTRLTGHQANSVRSIKGIPRIGLLKK